MLMGRSTPRKIIEDLQKAYRDIADDFSHTRQRPWPEFTVFTDFIPDGSKILDLGCGNGRFYGSLQEKKKTVDYTGVDFCPEFLEIARKKYPNQEFLEQDITRLNVPRKFDRIISVAAFHHIPSRKLRKQTLKLMFDHLEDDGMLLLSVWNLWQKRYWEAHLRAFFRFIGSFFRRDPRDLFIPFGRKKVQRYYHAFVPFELKQLLKQAGFRVEVSQVSRHNYLFVCKKHLLSTRSQPLFVREKRLTPELGKAPLTSFFHRQP